MEVKKTTIAIIMGKLNVGGTEIALVNMLKFFDYDKYKVDVWANEGGNLDLKRMPEEVDIKYWSNHEEDNTGFSIRSFGNKFLSKKHVEDFNRNLKYFVKSKKDACEFRYDCMICYYGYSDEVVFTSLYRFYAKKKMLWVHGNYNHTRLDKGFWSKEYNLFDHIVCVSESNRELFLQKHPELKDKTHVIYNVLDTEEIQRLSEQTINYEFDEYTLATVGRLSQEKGQDIIPEVAARLINSGLPVKWYVVGEGPLRSEINDNIQKYHVEDNVILTGQLENPYPFIKRCAVYVQPSLMEGYCVSTLEAKSLGKVVVTTDVPGMREQLEDRQTGFIVERNNIDALYAMIYTLLENGEYCRHIQDNIQKQEIEIHGESGTMLKLNGLMR